MPVGRALSTTSGEVLALKLGDKFLKNTEGAIGGLRTANKGAAFFVGVAWRFYRAEIMGWIRQQPRGGKVDKM